MVSKVSHEQVALVFQAFLNRTPEPAALDALVGVDSVDELVRIVRDSPEAHALRARTISSPFLHFNTCIDADTIVRSHEYKQRTAVPGRLVNYLGVVIDPAFLPSLLDGKQGEVEDVPIPANWHADMAEFAAALRAVDLATNVFRVVELGCGWGCWLLNTGVAARRRGLKVDLIGIEGDAGHASFARQGCAENGFSEGESRVVQAIVGPHAGTALFPKQDRPGDQWGLEAVFNPSDEQLRYAQASGRYDILPITTMDDLVQQGQTIDLLHIDIQGVEADFIEECVEAIDRIVSFMVVGTHSREIEGRIFKTMLDRGWQLEIERPAFVSLQHGPRPITTIDGVQGWRNLKLRPHS